MEHSPTIMLPNCAARATFIPRKVCDQVAVETLHSMLNSSYVANQAAFHPREDQDQDAVGAKDMIPKSRDAALAM